MSFKNEIVRRFVFKLKPGCSDPDIEEDHIVLKDFVYQVLSPEREKQQREELLLTYRHLPVSHYDPELTDYQNQLNYSKLLENPRLSALAPSETIYARNYLSTSTGCTHYLRNCSKQCFDCKKIYPCRLCHDDNEDHELPREKTEFFSCNICLKLTKPGITCELCNTKFGEFYCDICKLVCGIGPEAKPNYHCSGCGCCMVGIQAENTHCEICESCYPSSFIKEHKCLQEIGNCVVCLGTLKKSIYGAIVLNCNHGLHEHCYDELMAQGLFSCPVCRRFLPVEGDVDFVKSHFKKIYLKTFQIGRKALTVQCNDCMTKFSAFEHPEIYYCNTCDNFNCQIIENIGDNEGAENEVQKCKMKPLYADFQGIQTYLNSLNSELTCDRVSHFFKKLQIEHLKDRFLIAAKVANSQLFDDFEGFLHAAKRALRFGISFDGDLEEGGEEPFWFDEGE
ncbi:CHY zinc finger domain-containing protein [Spironucleus salmonicida]|uniref:CHY zinc finger domain-containing protein n=1 Tax=Spironucleus salmonicida TaxID=348837 RepID=A0A9P8LU33_9EUKA|nr:CHY zinc finger domain-containing protein [Spironucleus salmonicida]